MLVACFCGQEFESDGAVATCPACAELATIPQVTTAESEQMRRELDTLLVDHEVSRVDRRLA